MHKECDTGCAAVFTTQFGLCAGFPPFVLAASPRPTRVRISTGGRRNWQAPAYLHVDLIASGQVIRDTLRRIAQQFGGFGVYQPAYLEARHLAAEEL